MKRKARTWKQTHAMHVMKLEYCPVMTDTGYTVFMDRQHSSPKVQRFRKQSTMDLLHVETEEKTDNCGKEER
jgi:hypothetical protein